MISQMPNFSPDNGHEIGPEMTEDEAAEMLQTEQEFSPEEQERLINLVKGPNQSMYVLGFFDVNDKTLTETQEEKLLKQVLSDREVIEIFYITLTDSGVDLNETEKRWLERLEEGRR